MTEAGILVAPIAAVADYLGKYRRHATNLFQTAAAESSPVQIEHRMTIRATLLAEIQKWLLRHGHGLHSTDLRAHLSQWKKAQAQDGFPLRAPGHWKYFRHLWLSLDVRRDHDVPAPDLQLHESLRGAGLGLSSFASV